MPPCNLANLDPRSHSDNRPSSKPTTTKEKQATTEAVAGPKTTTSQDYLDYFENRPNVWVDHTSAKLMATALQGSAHIYAPEVNINTTCWTLTDRTLHQPLAHEGNHDNPNRLTNATDLNGVLLDRYSRFSTLGITD